MKKILLTLLLSVAYLSNIQAQNTEIAMADQFRQDGKIYVVLAILLIILFGIFIYLITIDRKVSKLEEKNH